MRGLLIYRLLYAMGWLLAHLPESFIKCLCQSIGWLFYTIPNPRIRLLRSNLHHAFPERSLEWLDRTSGRIGRRTIEMGIFTLICPHLSKEQLADRLQVDAEVNRTLMSLLEEGRPIVLFGMHFSMIEAFNAWPAKTGFVFPETTILFRPHDNPRIDALIKRHRERYGFRLHSRKEGLREMGETLRANGIGGVLFDQNSRHMGSLIPFFGRVASATELPGLLVKKHRAIPVMLACQRTGFHRASLVLERLDCPPDPEQLTLASNAWLERRLRQSDELLIDWLWVHNRWKILHQPHERLGMRHKKILFDPSSGNERKFRVAVLFSRFSKAPDEACSFLQAIRKSRPDAEITVISTDASRFHKNHVEEVDGSYDWPESPAKQRALAVALRDRYLDVLLLPEDNRQLQNFARLTKIPQRFGVMLKNGKRRGLTHVWRPDNADQWREHPDWIAFGKHFGMET